MMHLFIKFISKFCKEDFVIAISTLGFIWGNRCLFYNTICLALLSLIFNVALKVTFQVPTPKALSSGRDAFAFPSGHTQTPVIFYGYLAYCIKNFYFRLIIIGGLISLFKIILLEKYHGMADILGGIFFAIILVFIRSFILSKILKPPAYIDIVLATMMIAYIYIVYGKIFNHAWIAYYLLLGFSISYLIFDTNAKETKINKLFITLICFIIFKTINPYLLKHAILILPPYLQKLPYFLQGFTLPAAIYIVNYLSNQLSHIYKSYD